jgi:DNA-directed RNA polymerase specialized sigma24 family protein
MALAALSLAAEPTPIHRPPKPPIPFPGPRPLPPAARDAAVTHTGVLFARYAEQVRSYAQFKLWAYGVKGTLSDIADEVCSETFLRWLELARSGYPLPPDEDELHQRNFLLGTARMLCLQRVNVSAQRCYSMQARWPKYYDPPAPPLLLPSSSTAEVDVIASAQQQRVSSALSRIGVQHTALLTDAYVRDRGHTELAAARGVSKQKIEGKMIRARHAFIAAYR